MDSRWLTRSSPLPKSRAFPEDSLRLSQADRRQREFGSRFSPRPKLVRALYFDKPPNRPWSLPWHRDTNVPLAGSPPCDAASRASVRAGVPHIAAAAELLQEMFTLRVHLDRATENNGALQVAPGSHVTPDVVAPERTTIIETSPGDVVLMKPLLLHRSADTAVEDARRRVVHLEFSCDASPGPRLAWAPVWPSQKRTAP